MEPKTYFFMFPSKHGGTVTTTTIALLEDESKTNDFKTTRYIMRAQTQKIKQTTNCLALCKQHNKHTYMYMYTISRFSKRASLWQDE